MRVVVEIYNGCVHDVAADSSCEVLILDRDELADDLLPNGEPGYVSEWLIPGSHEEVDQLYVFAGYEQLNPT